jgi:hypothetical protein
MENVMMAQGHSHNQQRQMETKSKILKPNTQHECEQRQHVCMADGLCRLLEFCTYLLESTEYLCIFCDDKKMLSNLLKLCRKKM